MLTIHLERLSSSLYRSTARADGRSLGYLDGDDAARIIRSVIRTYASHHMVRGRLMQKYVHVSDAAKAFVPDMLEAHS